MKELPIIFNSEMVRAILDGRKTQTRRIVKIPAWGQEPIELCDKAGMGQSAIDWPNVVCTATGCLAEIPFPYGWRGDRLWVRETWQPTGVSLDMGTQIHYKADGSAAWKKGGNVSLIPAKWRPSIHMPRWASRITLEITSVRVERLNEICEADALAEGCEESWTEQWWQGYREFDGGLMHQQATGDVPPAWMIEPKPMNTDHLRRSAKDGFRLLWESINGAGSWAANPWVWALAFKRIAEAAHA